MNDIEQATRRLADATGAKQGRHEVDGRDRVSLSAGWAANKCTAAADAGRRLAQMTFALAEGMEGCGTPAQQRVTGAVATLCVKIAAKHPNAPCDAIREACRWTGATRACTAPARCFAWGCRDREPRPSSSVRRSKTPSVVGGPAGGCRARPG
jgi:hypothetical protein